MAGVFNLAPALKPDAPIADALLERYLEDLAVVPLRNVLVNVSPGGYIGPRWLPDGDSRGHWQAMNFDARRALFAERVLHREQMSETIGSESQAAARSAAVMGERGRDAPRRRSDPAPYSAMAFLRDHWEPGAEYLLLDSFLALSQDRAVWSAMGNKGRNKRYGSGSMRYDLMKNGRSMLSSEGIVIDKKPSNGWHGAIQTGGKTVGAIFRKEYPRSPVKASPLRTGLAYDYFEDTWPTLFAYTECDGVLEPKSHGSVRALLDPGEVAAIRKTERAYAIQYRGYIDVPATGICSFYAPEHLYTPTMDAGFDLRVWIAGDEQFPSPTLHSENVWHIPLEKGLHRFRVTYVDYRWKQFHDEYWMNWQEEEMWQGTPTLEVSGPGITRQPMPTDWLRHPSTKR